MENAKLDGEAYKPFRFENGGVRARNYWHVQGICFSSLRTTGAHARDNVQQSCLKNIPTLRLYIWIVPFSAHDIFQEHHQGCCQAYHGTLVNKVEEAGLHSFNVIATTFYEHYDEILNFYNKCSSNAMAESFNAKSNSSGQI